MILIREKKKKKKKESNLFFMNSEFKFFKTKSKLEVEYVKNYGKMEKTKSKTFLIPSFFFF